MESPGEYLKRERELRRASLTSIFEATRIPLKYLEALEADDYESLPHPTFVKGFIKSYCKYLGLDETDAVLRYEIYMKERSDKAETRPTLTIKRTEPKELPKGDRIFNNSWAIAALAGCALVIVFSYSLYSKHKARVAQVNEAAGQASQGAAIPPPDSAAVKPASPAEGQDKVNTAPKEAKAAAPAAADADASDADAADENHTLVISATEVVWIKVKIDGGEPFDVVLKKGESVVWKATDSFSLVVGNAGGVNLVYDGEKLSSLGKSGEVVTVKLPRA